MSRSRIIPSSIRTSLLSRKPSASVLRPPNLLGIAPKTYASTPSRLGIHPNRSHLSLPPFAAIRAFSTSAPRPSSSSSSPSYTYSVSAAYSDKKDKLDLSRNHFTFDPRLRSTNGTEDHIRPKSGQDSYFISSIGETSNNMAFGVVDGVGGWEESGVDPADFAHTLCDYMADAASRYPYGFEKLAKDTRALRPVELLDVGYERVMDDAAVAAGGCTACVATASASGALTVANLGDSGYIHLSPFRLNYLSPAQTHRFNTPFQLSKLPAKMLAQVALFGGAKPYSELPSDSAISTQQLEHGDVVVFATDGVWDNLSAEDVLRLVSRLMVKLGGWNVPPEDGGSKGAMKTPSVVSDAFAEVLENASIKVPSSPSAGDVNASVHGLSAVLATAITHEAKIASLDKKRDGPFAKEVQRVYPEEKWSGGKVDDICCVVCVVSKQD